ncbi:hypothetical protein SLS56_005307 [Neofusicoccum ribis]|uniref:VOC domain-containing protein n=1 Tax=Neofusicoccum ribis TaxID=45134 RepID=A0ABR3SUS1_9PEZI
MSSKSSASKVRVVRLAHVRYQHPDMEWALAFLQDFGFVDELRGTDEVYLRGYGIQPYVYVAEKSPDAKRHFKGGFWVVDSIAELEKAASHPKASPIREIDAPGGGKIVTIEDPNCFLVGFVFGQNLRQFGDSDSAIQLERTPPTPNTANSKLRKGTYRRFEKGPSPVHKLGHYGFMLPPAKYDETKQFYTDLMNITPTDSVFDPSTGKDETCFMHIDLGPDFTDHHSFFLGVDPQAAAAYVHHSSYEVNDFDTQTLGHDWLRSKGWTNCWGVGRHVLGSQIFDYWFDGSGNIVEHYTDGDLVNGDTPPHREPASPDSLHIWGPNIPLAFVTGKVEDSGKPLGPPPVPLEA